MDKTICWDLQKRLITCQVQIFIVTWIGVVSVLVCIIYYNKKRILLASCLSDDWIQLGKRLMLFQIYVSQSVQTCTSCEPVTSVTEWKVQIIKCGRWKYIHVWKTAMQNQRLFSVSTLTDCNSQCVCHLDDYYQSHTDFIHPAAS